MTENLLNDEAKNVGLLTAIPSAAPFEGFNEWLMNIIRETRPDCVIAIARGAVRLLQIQNVKEVLGDIPILSDFALPFLEENELRDKRILLFDDSVIFGSTLSQVREYVLALGATVFCAAYTVDRHNFLGEKDPETGRSVSRSIHSEIPIRAKSVLWPDQIRRHHNKLIDTILATKRDYNIDFPKIRLITSDYSADDLPYIITLLSKAKGFKNIYDVSSSVSAANGAFRYTALVEPRLSGQLHEHTLAVRPYTKVRMIFVPDSNEIHLTPMPQLTLADDGLPANVRFKDLGLQSLWQEFTQPRQSEGEFYRKAIFRLLTLFKGSLLGESLRRELVIALAPELIVRSYQLVHEDINPALGNHNSQVLRNLWLYLNKLDIIPGLESDETDALVDSREYINELLLEAINKKWEYVPRLKPHGGELTYEILGKVFLTLRAVTDSAKAREHNPDASRLEVGLTYEGIRVLLERYCTISLSSNEISLAIDMCADSGQAVPKVICQDGVWLRAFYSGENEDAHPTLQLKDAFHRGYSELIGQRARPLSEFDLLKVAVTLKDLFPWLPISTEPYTFGRIATVSVGYHKQGLIEWLINRGTGPLRKDVQGSECLVLNDGYEVCVDPSWPSNKSKDFLDAFEYLSIAFTKLKSAPKLLLSTCRTHRHTYNAVAVEAYNWTANPRGDFGALLRASRTNETGLVRDPETTLQSIYYCTRFLTEAREKYIIFHDEFNSVKKQLEKSFKKQSGGAARLWQFKIEKDLLDASHDPEIKLRFDNLMPILTQMRHLLAYYAGILLNFGFINEYELRNTFEKDGCPFDDKRFKWLIDDDPRRRALLYNENIRRKKVSGLSFEKTELPLNSPQPNEPIEKWLNSIFRIVETCFNEVSSSLFNSCPRYETQNPDFPFSPENDRRVQSDGTIETVLRNVFILTIEIIKSTDNVQTNPMKDIIIRTFDDFARRCDIYFDKSGNDSFVACSFDPMVLIDISKKVMVEGEALKRAGGTFGGTRKGIFFGTVRQVVDSDGHERISDALTPNVLPQAFSMLDAIDDRFENDPAAMNLAMIVDESAASDLFPRLNIQAGKKNAFRVKKKKHFFGTCYCFNLSNWEIQ